MALNLSTLLDFLFPARCLGCGRSGHYLCPACLEQIPESEPTEDRAIFALYTYDHPAIKKAIWLLKYRGVKVLARTFANLIYEHLLEDWADDAAFHPGDKPWLVIPIPLSPARQKERGFNQAGLIAQHLVKHDPANLILADNLLLKIKDTPSQVSIKNRAARLRNLRGAFRVAAPEQVAGRNIILVDDVLTTGGTLTEARRELYSSGARRVLGITLAHG